MSPDEEPSPTQSLPSPQNSPPAQGQPKGSEYGGPALGRDDPVWSDYIKQSTQRDWDLVKGWNTSMDLLLLFAGLFSAVVTAFLNESYKNLQPDAALITAASVSRMVVLVEAIASGQPLAPVPSDPPLPSLDNFRPTHSDIVINHLWFFSLALSMSVALMSMLVKQWGEAYLIGPRFDPHYVQARTRQARYNELKWWKVKFVVRLLPVMMHISLGLFLIGLLLFLKSLKFKLWWPVLGALVVALAFYLLTTLAPLFRPFCPYDTPLSSKTLRGIVFPPFKWVKGWDISCEQKEKMTSTSTARDKLAAQAMLWLIRHSQGGVSADGKLQDGISIQESIRAIANTVAGPEFWDHLVNHKLVTFMAQNFTSFFEGTLNPQEETTKSDPNVFQPLDERQVSLCSQALAKIAKYSYIHLFQDAGPRTTASERAIEKAGRIMLSESYFFLVHNGLLRLITHPSIDVRASAYCAASAWRTSIGRTIQFNGERPFLEGLVRFIREYSSSSALQERLLITLMESLAVEASHMIWELKEEDLKKTFEDVVGLCLSDPQPDLSAEQGSHSGQETHPEQNLFYGKDHLLFNEPVRKATTIALAVVAALLNDYRRISGDEVGRLKEGGSDKFEIYNQYIKAQSAYKHRYPYSTGSYTTYSRQWRAVWIAESCTKNPGYLDGISNALLFFGLSGILKSCQMNSSRFERVVKLFVDLLELTEQTPPSSMTLPFILTTSYDVRSQVAKDLIDAFHNQSSESNSDAYKREKAKSKLLEGLSEHGRWIEFEPTLLVEILALLKSARHIELQSQCIITLDRYWFAKSPANLHIYNLPDWQLFVDSGIIRILIECFQLFPPGNRLRRGVLSCFEKLARTVDKQRESEAQATTNQAQPTQTSSNPGDIHAPQDILDTLTKLLLEEETLFFRLAKQILCNTDHPDIQLSAWRQYILELPSKLPTGPGSQASSTSPVPGPSTRPVAPTPVPDPANVPLPPMDYDETVDFLLAFAEDYRNARGNPLQNAQGSGN